MSATAGNRRITPSEPPPSGGADVNEELSERKAPRDERSIYRGPIDVPLLAVTLLILSFGIVMVYSASAVFAARSHGSAQYYLLRQASFAIVVIKSTAFVNEVIAPTNG